MGDIIVWINQVTNHFDNLLSRPLTRDNGDNTDTDPSTRPIPPALHNAILKGHSLLQKYYAFTDECAFYRIAIHQLVSLFTAFAVCGPQHANQPLTLNSPPSLAPQSLHG